MILILSYVLGSLTFLYLLISIILIIGTSRLKKKIIKSTVLPFVSIIVPAKNEENTIGDCLDSLLNQQYPYDNYEIIVVNDRSSDKTPAIIKSYQEQHKIIKSLDIESNISGLTGKQNAINEGLKLCKGEIIFNIDADCIAPSMLVKQTVSYFSQKIGLTIGFHIPYSKDGLKPIFADLQALDMLFLMDAAAGSIGVNVHVSCAGSNLAYRKTILADKGYHDIGFTVTEDTALIQSIAKKSDWDVTVVYDKDTVVMTPAETRLKKFLAQRIRWTLGGLATRSWVLIPLYSMFFYHLCMVVSIILAFFIESLAGIVIVSFIVKLLIDFIRCWRVCKEFQRLDLLNVFVLYEYFMMFYSIISGFCSLFIRKIQWKDDTYRIFNNANNTKVTSNKKD